MTQQKIQVYKSNLPSIYHLSVFSRFDTYHEWLTGEQTCVYTERQTCIEPVCAAVRRHVQRGARFKTTSERSLWSQLMQKVSSDFAIL